jgi:hypothetical protein
MTNEDKVVHDKGIMKLSFTFIMRPLIEAQKDQLPFRASRAKMLGENEGNIKRQKKKKKTLNPKPYLPINFFNFFFGVNFFSQKKF